MNLRHAGRQLAVVASCFVAVQVVGQSKKINVLNISTPQQLQQYFKYTGHDVPLISGHRGGPDTGAPENSLQAFEHSLTFTPATFEIDPRLTKDSVVVLLHDDTLDRTTTGKGKLNSYTW